MIQYKHIVTDLTIPSVVRDENDKFVEFIGSIVFDTYQNTILRDIDVLADLYNELSDPGTDISAVEAISVLAANIGLDKITASAELYKLAAKHTYIKGDPTFKGWRYLAGAMAYLRYAISTPLLADFYSREESFVKHGNNAPLTAILSENTADYSALVELYVISENGHTINPDAVYARFYNAPDSIKRDHVIADMDITSDGAIIRFGISSMRDFMQWNPTISTIGKIGLYGKIRGLDRELYVVNAIVHPNFNSQYYNIDQTKIINYGTPQYTNRAINFVQYYPIIELIELLPGPAEPVYVVGVDKHGNEQKMLAYTANGKKCIDGPIVLPFSLKLTDANNNPTMSRLVYNVINTSRLDSAFTLSNLFVRVLSRINTRSSGGLSDGLYIASAPDYTPITFRSSLPDEILNKIKPAGFYLNTLYTDVSCNGKTGCDSNATLNSTMLPIQSKQLHGITTNTSILSTVAIDINYITGTTLANASIQNDNNIVVSHHTGHIARYTTTVQGGSSEN